MSCAMLPVLDFPEHVAAGPLEEGWGGDGGGAVAV